MAVYTCNKCGKKFSQKIHWTYHTDKRKTPCDKHSCEFCKKIFTNKRSLKKHQKSKCETQNDGEFRWWIHLSKYEKTNNRRIKDMNNQIKHLKQMNNDNSHHNDNTHNDNEIKIQLVAFGQEDMLKLGKKIIVKALSRGCRSIEQLTLNTHFNKQFPEYHNVYVPSLKGGHGMIYNGKIWQAISLKELVNQNYDEKKSFLDKYCEDYESEIPEQAKKMYNRYDKFVKKADESSHDSRAIKKQTKLIFYNYKHIAKVAKKRCPSSVKSKIENLISMYNSMDNSDNELTKLLKEEEEGEYLIPPVSDPPASDLNKSEVIPLIYPEYISKSELNESEKKKDDKMSPKYVSKFGSRYRYQKKKLCRYRLRCKYEAKGKGCCNNKHHPLDYLLCYDFMDMRRKIITLTKKVIMLEEQHLNQQQQPQKRKYYSVHYAPKKRKLTHTLQQPVADTKSKYSLWCYDCQKWRDCKNPEHYCKLHRY